MLFNTLAFAKFFCFVFFVSWGLARWPRARFGFLAAMSYVFYAGIDLLPEPHLAAGHVGFTWPMVDAIRQLGIVGAIKERAPHLMFVPIVFIGSTVDYWLARWIADAGIVGGAAHPYRTKDGEKLPPLPPEVQRKRRLALWVTIVMNTSVLLVFKYYNFVLDQIDWIAKHVGFHFPNLHAHIPLPIGISFFTFMSLSYVVDVYRREIPPSKNYIHYLTYICFFPHLVAGPIIRGRDLLPLFARPVKLTSAAAGEGMFLIAAGIFKKVVISDYLALNLVDRVVGEPTLYSALENLTAVFGYAIQVYCDFSGYSDVAIGAALLLGYRFKINFDAPYKSSNVAEFWRRWHISLSSWLRDYIYIPLGGSRVGTARRYFNLWITMVICGIWHGAAWSFVVFGIVQGFAVLATHLYYKLAGKKLGEGEETDLTPSRVLAVLATFFFTALTFVLIRTGSEPAGLEKATLIYRQVFSWQSWSGFFHALLHDRAHLGAYYPNIHKWVVLIIAGGLLVQWFPRKVYAEARDAFIKAPAFVQACVLFAVALLLRQAASTEAVPFVYFQF